MEFLRVYLNNDGNIKRGAVSKKGTGELIPDNAREIWFNGESGMICQVDLSGTAFYHCTSIQGDPTFLVRFFKDHFEKKTFDELVGAPKVEKKVTRKRK